MPPRATVLRRTRLHSWLWASVDAVPGWLVTPSNRAAVGIPPLGRDACGCCHPQRRDPPPRLNSADLQAGRYVSQETPPSPPASPPRRTHPPPPPPPPDPPDPRSPPRGQPPAVFRPAPPPPPPPPPPKPPPPPPPPAHPSAPDSPSHTPHTHTAAASRTHESPPSLRRHLPPPNTPFKNFRCHDERSSDIANTTAADHVHRTTEPIHLVPLQRNRRTPSTSRPVPNT